jgi:Flp pilus assembly protein TadD
MVESHAWVGMHLLDHGRTYEALQHIARSLRGNPRQPKLFGYLALALAPPRLTGAARRAYRRAKALLRAPNRG